MPIAASDVLSPCFSQQPSLLLRYRRVAAVLAHVFLWAVAFIGAFTLRFDFSPSAVASHFVWRWLAILLVIRTVTSAAIGAFHGLWRYTGSHDLRTLLKSTTLASAIFVAALSLGGMEGFPRSIFVIDWLASIILVGGLRFTARTLRELSLQAAAGGADKRRVLIVGAGNSGEMLLREIQKSHASRYLPAGFVDDDRRKHGNRIHNVPILGAIAEAPRIVSELGIQEIIIAIPTANKGEMRRILALCNPAGVPIRTLPGIDQLIDGKVRVNQVRDVAIEDLLGRAQINLDGAVISTFLRGKRILVTGAGGSIGSELCRQVARFGPERLALVEQAENALFHVDAEISAHAPDTLVTAYVADVLDRTRLRQIFARERPQVVLHAAAHKHVPLMERNPTEAIKNNVLAIRELADLADELDVAHFVMISTDKAVNPSSVMGASKRGAEMYVQAISTRSATRFSIVRFGNVLGSAGSVIPIFKEQICRGGPLTVTHPDMRRYFMTIPEACQLVLQAGAMGHGGELFVLDMGEPVRIVDLARDLIALSGLREGDDIEICFTGVRPGEKLSEELHMDDELVDRTRHPKIFVGRFDPPRFEEINRQFDMLARLTHVEDSPARLRAALMKLIPEYKPLSIDLIESDDRPSAGKRVSQQAGHDASLSA